MSSEVSKYCLTILPKITASASVLGSTMIICTVLSKRKHRSHTQQRLVGAMSVIDILLSSCWLFTNFFVPTSMDEFKGPLGNATSCSIQGFIVQFSIGGVLYNASLSLYYVLVIKYAVAKETILKLEYSMHTLALIFGLSTATIALDRNLYKDANWDCWITPEKNSYQWILFFGPLWIAIVFCTMNMILLYRYVRYTESNSNEYQIEQFQKTRAVATQAVLYVGAFYTTWMFPTIVRILQICGVDPPPQALVVLAGTFIPIQGFFNALVYFRLRFTKLRRQHTHKSNAWIIKHIIRTALCCCCCCCCCCQTANTTKDTNDSTTTSNKRDIDIAARVQLYNQQCASLVDSFTTTKLVESPTTENPTCSDLNTNTFAWKDHHSNTTTNNNDDDIENANTEKATNRTLILKEEEEGRPTLSLSLRLQTSNYMLPAEEENLSDSDYGQDGLPRGKRRRRRRNSIF